MTRPTRQSSVVPGLPHHIVFRGNNRRLLFTSLADRLRFLKYAEEAPGREECPMHGCALMGNHGHVVATPTSTDALSTWMKSTLQRYATYWNTRRDGSGKLFEQRFHALPIRSERQLAATLAYVDLNPERAGIGARGRTWSTRTLHDGSWLEHPMRALWTPCDWWLGLGADDETRYRHYAEHLELRRDAWECDVVRCSPVSRSLPDGPRLRRPDQTRAR